MTQRDRLLISGLVFIVLSGALWFMLVAPQRQRARELDDKVVAAQSDLNAAHQKSAATASARKDYGLDLAAIAALHKALPDDDQTAALLYQLNRAAGNADIKLKSINPGVAGAGTTAAAPTTTLPAGVQEMSLDLTFEGAYSDLQRFLARLQKATTVVGDSVQVNGRLVNVKGVKLSVDASKKGGLVATVTAATYINAPATAATGTTTPGAGTAAPATTAPSAAAPTTAPPSTAAPATSTPAPAASAPPVQTAVAGAG